MQQVLSRSKSAGKSHLGFGQLMTTAMVLFAMLLINNTVQAQSANGRFYSYDFSSVTNQNIVSYPVYFGNTTYIDTAGLTITEGGGLSAGAAQFANAITAQGVNAASEAAAVQAGDYFQFTVNVKSGFEFRLDSLIMRWQYQVATTTMNFAVRSSADNYVRTLATASQVSGTAFSNQVTVMTLTKPFYSSSNVTFRLYVWGANNQTRDFRITDGSATVNHDLSLWGRTSAVNSLMQAFDFSTSLGSETTRPTYTCNNTFIDTAGVIISRSATGLTAQTTTAGSYGANSFNTNSQANAIAGADYFQFQLKPKAGYEYSLDRIALRYFAATGITNYTLRSSQDAYTNNIATGTLTQNANSTEDIVIRAAGTNTIQPLSTDSSITYRLYLWTTGTTNLQFRFTDGTANNTFNYDIAFYGTMTTATIPTATLSSVGATTACVGAGVSLKVTTLGGTAPFTVWLKDNLGLQRVHTQLAADTTFTIFPQTNRTYSIDSVKDVMDHKATSLSGTVSLTVTSSPVIASAGTTISRTLTHLDGYTLTYASGDSCKSWVKITDSVGGTNPGSTNCLAEVLASSPMNTTARAFVGRRINITPTTNGVARVTLLYTQAEFTAFNSLVTYQQKLPINSTDTVGMKSKIMIRRTTGSLETASITSFSPDSITWNANTSTWEVNFRVNDGVLGGNYYLSPQFTSTKLVTGVTHTASTPITGQTTASITVDWDDVSGVTQYRMRFRLQGGSWNASTITGSQRIMNLQFDKTYEVQVRAYESASVQGEYTTTYTFNTPASPGKLPSCLAPTDIAVTLNSPVSATLSWTSATFGVNYFVEMRAVNSLVWGGTTTTGNSVTFPALTPGASYEYRIRTTCLTGYTEFGTSSFSAIDTFVMQTLSACGNVTNLNTVSTSATSASISWTPVAFATSYQVQMRLKNTASWGGTTTASSSFTFNNLSGSSIYEYRVRAMCNAVPAVTTTTTGLFTSVAEFTTASAPVLGTCLPPTNIVAVPTSNSVSITWDSAANDMSYFINIKQANAASWGGTTVNTLSRTFTSLSPSTDYQIRIRTACTPGTTTSANSVFSDTVFFTTTSIANKAIFDEASSAIWNVYPNPTRDNLHVDFNSQNTENVRVEVRDMTGRLIQTQQYEPMMGKNTLDISLQSAANGLYLIQIYQGSKLQFMNKVQKTY